MVSLPSAEEFGRIERMILAGAPVEAAQGWSAAKAEFAAVSGVSVEDLLAAIGPELVMFSDRAGDYIGMRVRDSARLTDVIERLVASAGIQIEEREVAGGRIRFAELPRSLGVPDEVFERRWRAVTS